MRADERPEWLDDGEEVLWAGAGSLGLAAVRVLTRVALAAGFTYLVLRVSIERSRIGGDLEALLRLAFREQPVPVIAVALMVVVLPLAGAVRLARARYTITDRRLVAWRPGGRIEWSLTPDLVLAAGRGPLLAASDLRFNRTIHSSSDSESRSRHTAFRCLADAGAVRDRVVRWREELQEELKRAVRERTPVTSRGGRFTVDAPAAWSLREYWLEESAKAGLIDPLADTATPAADLMTGAAWNCLVLTGPWRTSVSIESYAGDPPSSDRGDGGREPPSWLLRALGAGEVEREEQARLGGLVGRRARWSLSGSRREGPRRHGAEYLFNQWVLPADGRWYRITAGWSAALPEAEAALQEVLDTFQPVAMAGMPS